MILAVQTGSMTHSQESRVSSSQDNFRLSEESRSSVSALVSRLNSSALGVDSAENEKLRGDSNKTKEQKMQDPFPWMPGFCSICQATVGSRNVKHLENLMNIYLENVTPNVKDCYSKANRAAKLKRNMNDTLIFFHLFYQEIKEALENSSYLDKMTPLVSMFMDMEIKASIRGKESLKKVASRLTSSLYIFLDNSEEHMLDAILMTKYVNKNYREICHPLLWKLLNNISTYPMYDMLYVRCLLTFKLWKKIVPDLEERKRINKTAVQKLHAPPNLMENVKAIGNVLPRIPKTKKNITLFLMQSNFNLKNACQEFLKSVKKSQKTAYSQGLGSVEIDKPLFFINNSGNSSSRLNEKEDEGDSGCSNNLINDIWSSISTVESNVPQTKRVEELSNDKTVEVDLPEVPKKKRKLGKKVKKGKKKVKVSSGTKLKKKKKLKNSESAGTEKENKKASKLKNKKKKKKKLRQTDESSTLTVKQIIPQGDENSQVKAKQISSQVEECNQLVIKPALSPPTEECNQAQVKRLLPQAEECRQVNMKADLLQVKESIVLKVQSVSQVIEECKESKVEKASSQAIECDQVKVNPLSPQLEEYEQLKVKQALRLIKDFEPIKMEEAKVEPHLELPKTEKVECPLSSSEHIREASISSKIAEPLVKKEKVEVVPNICVHSQHDVKQNVRSEIMEQAVTVSCISSEKKVNTLVECNKPSMLTEESVLPSVDLTTKSDNKEKVDSVFDNPRPDLFTVEKPKDTLNEEVENLSVAIPLVAEEVVVDYCHKPKITESTVPVPMYSVDVEICDSSIKQEVCDNSESMETSDISKAVSIETDSEVEILEELKPQEAGKCDVSPSEEEIVLGDDGDLLTRQNPLNNIFATENGHVVIEMLDGQYPMSRDVLSVESELEAQNPVCVELDQGPSNIAGFDNSMGDSFYSKIIKDGNPSLYYPPNYEDWNPYELERPILSPWMEDDEEDEVQESDSPKTVESSTPKRGMGKMSFSDVMSYSRQKEFQALTYGRNSSQALLPMNSSESGSATTETSGSSSPRSESAMDSVEGVGQDNVDVCDRLIKTAESYGSSEHMTDDNNLRYYNSSTFQKSSDNIPCSKESFVLQSSYAPKVGDSQLDHAQVVEENVENSVVNRLSNTNCSKRKVPSSTPESSSHKNSATGVQLSPSKRKKSSTKVLPDQTVCSQNASGKQGASESTSVLHRKGIRGTWSESNIHGKFENYRERIPVVQYTQSSSSVNLYQKYSDLINTSSSALNPAMDFWRCSCSECSVGSVNFSANSLGQKSYSYYTKLPAIYETPNNWKSPNEKLLEKIEESLCSTTYDFNSDSSLPLKKRLKKAKISYEQAVDKSNVESGDKKKLEGFPSYPASPMMSIAQIDLANNDFYKKWNNYYVTTNKDSKSVIVDNRATSSTTSYRNSTYISSPNQPNLSIPRSTYDDNLVKSVQPNLYAHCGQCAEKAVSSVCDSTLYSSASSAGQVYPSTSMATYSCVSSPSTKVSNNSYSSQQALNSPYYPLSSRGYYGVQSSTSVDSSSSKQEYAQCDSGECSSDVKSNQSLSKEPFHAKFGILERCESLFQNSKYSRVTDAGVFQQGLGEAASVHGEQPCHFGTEKSAHQNQEDDDEEDDDGEDVEGEDEDDEVKETPKYSIVQKTYSRGCTDDSKKETTRIMPFRIFLNKNKNHKELAKNSCIRCRMVDCKGNCLSSSSEVDVSAANSEIETNDDEVSESKSHRKRGRRSRSSRDGDESVRKSKRSGKKHPLENTEFVMNYDKKRRKKHLSR